MILAVFPAVLQTAGANNDVKVDDIFSKQDKSNIVAVIDHPSEQVAQSLIRLALQGHVRKPNSTIVADPKKPHKENYSVSFTFKESPHSRKRPQYEGSDSNLDFSGQPCGMGLVTLVSDDAAPFPLPMTKGKNRNG